jgi:very-short-patch-repair endonuclease
MVSKRDADLGDADRCHVFVDARIAEIAAQQQNLISIEELLALGLSRAAVSKRVRSGRLHPKHRGVFAVGTPLLPPLGRERAALLAVPRAVLAGGSGAAVFGFLAAHPSGPVELHTTTNRRSRPGILVRRTTRLPPEDVRTYRGLPITSPARIVLDLTPRLDAPTLERLLAEVLTFEPSAAETLRRRGTSRITKLLEAGPRRTRSQNERRLLQLIRDAGLPVPKPNADVHGFEVDAYWPEHRLVVEVDDYFTHGDRHAFAKDRRQDSTLAAHGIRTRRITSTQLEAAALEAVALLGGELRGRAA